MKILIQVIATETDSQVGTIQRTWASKLHTSVKRVEFVYGIKSTGSTQISANHKKIYNVLAPFTETMDNIGRKTIFAITEALKDPDWNYLFRTNVSSYVDTFLLHDFLTKVPQHTIHYGGVTVFDLASETTFASGCGFLLSRYACELLVENYFDLDFTLIDDVMIGKFFFEKGIGIVCLPRVDVMYSCNGIRITEETCSSEALLPRVFHYRVKCESNRHQDVTRLKNIHFVKRQDKSKNRLPPTVEQWKEYQNLTKIASELQSKRQQVNVLIHGPIYPAMDASLALDCRIRLFRDVKLAEAMDVVIGKPLSTSPPLPFVELPKSYVPGLCEKLYRSAFDTMPKIALCMIVKNESKCILECLQSVVDLIDYFVISDTGSTDNTCELISQFMSAHNKPGQLLYDKRWETRPFHFADARNLCLDTAAEVQPPLKYTFTLDADEVLSTPSAMNIKRLLRGNSDFESFNVICKTQNIEFQRTLFIDPSKALNYRYTGCIHECAVIPGATVKNRPFLNLLLPQQWGMVLCKNQGARSFNPDKYLGDAQIIESDMARPGQPYDSRMQFYLAQVLSDHQITLEDRLAKGDKTVTKTMIDTYRQRALEAFQKRVGLAVEAQERMEPTEYYKALIMIARIRAKLFYDENNLERFEHTIEAYRQCIRFDPKRPDALLEMALFLEPHPAWKSIVFELAREAYMKRNEVFDEYLFIEGHVRNDAAIFYAKLLCHRQGSSQECLDVIHSVLNDEQKPSELDRARCKTLLERLALANKQ